MSLFYQLFLKFLREPKEGPLYFNLDAIRTVLPEGGHILGTPSSKRGDVYTIFFKDYSIAELRYGDPLDPKKITFALFDSELSMASAFVLNLKRFKFRREDLWPFLRHKKKGITEWCVRKKDLHYLTSKFNEKRGVLWQR